MRSSNDPPIPGLQGSGQLSSGRQSSGRQSSGRQSRGERGHGAPWPLRLLAWGGLAFLYVGYRVIRMNRPERRLFGADRAVPPPAREGGAPGRAR